MQMVRLALEYASRGWPVFPLKPRRKDPATPNGCKDATTRPARIQSLWRGRTNANPAIATSSRLFVLDIDGPEGEAALAALVAIHGALPRTYEVRTGRPDGGRQKYFRAPKLARFARIANSQGEHGRGLGRGLDVRGEGGYVVAAGSIHPSGLVYEVVCAVEPAEAPEWLLGLVVSIEPPPQPSPSSSERRIVANELDALARAALDSAPRRIENAKSGDRNRTLNREAHGLARAGVPRALAEPALKNAAIAAGLSAVETRKTFESGWSAGLRAMPLERKARR